MTKLNLQFVVPEDCTNYLASSARLRGVTATKLVRQIVAAVLRDQLILSVLDDKEEILVPKKTYVEKARESARKPNKQTISFKRSQPKTREELRRELAQAVVNTAEMPVE